MSNRVITFSDGFTSTTAPIIGGAPQSTYTIANNTAGGSLFIQDYTLSRTVFIDYELIRTTSLGTFVQTGSLILHYSTAWSLSEGNYSGDEMIVSSILNNEHIKVSLNLVTGALTYDSGNMLGTGYVGTFKLIVTKVI